MIVNKSRTTIEQKILEMIEERGMMADEARTVLAHIKDTESQVSMKGVWYRKAEDYPLSFLTALWMNVEREVLDWIDDNIPLAWYRPMFDN